MTRPASDEARLSEYSHLHAEKSQRAAFQQALLVLNLTVTGVFVGIVVDKELDLEALLVLSVTSPLFGLMWINHHMNIHRIAEYIDKQLWPWQPSWEKWIRKGQNDHPYAWKVVSVTTIYLSFAALAAVPLLEGWPFDDGSPSEWCPLFFLGAFLTLVFTVSYAFLVGKPALKRTS